MRNKRALLDVNVCLDLLLNRSPHSDSAAHIFQASEKGIIDAVISGISFDTMFYIMRPKYSVKDATNKLKKLLSITGTGIVNKSVVQNALDAEWNDFEDALHYFSAVSAKCDAVVTRNPKDFKLDSASDNVPVLTPNQFIAAHLL